MEGLRWPAQAGGSSCRLRAAHSRRRPAEAGKRLRRCFFSGALPQRAGAMGTPGPAAARWRTARGALCPGPQGSLDCALLFEVVCGATQRRAPIAGVCLKQPVLNGFAYLPESCLYSLSGAKRNTAKGISTDNFRIADFTPTTVNEPCGLKSSMGTSSETIAQQTRGNSLPIGSCSPWKHVLVAHATSGLRENVSPYPGS